jgi:transposase-like protein
MLDAIQKADGRGFLTALRRSSTSSTVPATTAAAKCLADDLDALVVHLRYPTRHRRRWRSANLLERSLAEVKRRTKVIGRFSGESSCVTLVWAVCLEAVVAPRTCTLSSGQCPVVGR